MADDDEVCEAALSSIDEVTGIDSSNDTGGSNTGRKEILQHDETEVPIPVSEELQLSRSGATGLNCSVRSPQLSRSCSPLSGNVALCTSIACRREVKNGKKRSHCRFKDSNCARRERKRETAYLRDRVKQLEAKLQSVKEWASRGSGVPTESKILRTQYAGSKASSTAPSLWKETAIRRRSERVKAQLENDELKVIIASQFKVAKDLHSILLKRFRQQITECSASMQRRSHTACLLNPISDFRADADDFQGLLRYLDDAYSQVDTVLAANGLARKERTLHDVQMREGVNGTYLEVFLNKVLPFNIYTTAEATWNYFKGSKKHRGTLYAKEAQSLDTPYTIIEHFSKELTAGNLSTDVCIKQILRRYVEAHREVVVWVASITPVSTVKLPFREFMSRHRSYAVIKRAKASTSQHELSILQLVSHGMLDTHPNTVHNPKYVRFLTDFLLNDAARNIIADQQLIENFLMDGILRR